jgi:hypothetical protein
MSEHARQRAEQHEPAPPLTPRDPDWHKAVRWGWSTIDPRELAGRFRAARRRAELEERRDDE